MAVALERMLLAASTVAASVVSCFAASSFSRHAFEYDAVAYLVAFFSSVVERVSSYCKLFEICKITFNVSKVLIL